MVAERLDREEEADGPVVAVECKTTRQGFEQNAMSVLFNRVRASLRKSRELDTVRKVHTLIEQHHGVFDYLIVTNRQFKLPDFRNREGYFILRGLEVQ